MEFLHFRFRIMKVRIKKKGARKEEVTVGRLRFSAASLLRRTEQNSAEPLDMALRRRNDSMRMLQEETTGQPAGSVEKR